MEWQPIDTAPQGVWVLVSGFRVDHFDWRAETCSVPLVMSATQVDGGWIWGRCDYGLGLGFAQDPTHWMPLPAPPQTGPST